jgi:hypothetical protein
MASKPSAKEIELHPDAWQRFERAACVVAKSPPQHRGPTKKKKSLVKRTKKKTGAFKSSE